MSCHHRQIQFPGQDERLLQGFFRLRRAGALQFEVKALRKAVPPSPCQLPRLRLVAVQQRLADIAEMRAGQGDQALAQAACQLPRLRLVAVQQRLADVAKMRAGEGDQPLAETAETRIC